MENKIYLLEGLKMPCCAKKEKKKKEYYFATEIFSVELLL